MGGIYFRPEVETACANCKKNYRTQNPHFNRFCSIKCEERYRQRVKNGMASAEPLLDFILKEDSTDYRINQLRERIKHLKNQLKMNGIRPKRTPYGAWWTYAGQD